jgi:hypothetical protein
MKRKVRVTVVSEVEVDSEWYEEDEDATDAEILAAEEVNWQEWVLDNVVSEEIEVLDPEDE